MPGYPHEVLPTGRQQLLRYIIQHAGRDTLAWELSACHTLAWLCHIGMRDIITHRREKTPSHPCVTWQLPMKHISSVRRSGHRNAFFHNYLPPSLVKNPFFTVSRLIVGFSGCKRWHLSVPLQVNPLTISQKPSWLLPELRCVCAMKM